MYTANIVDTVIFRSLGKPPNSQWQSLVQAVVQAESELWVPATIYRELMDSSADPPVNPYLDAGIEEGWIRVGTPIPGGRDDRFESVTDPVEKSRYLAEIF
jgi:hypothetical protein